MSSFGAIDVLGFALRHPVGRRSRLRTLGRIARWQWMARTRPGPFAMPWIDGTTLVAERSMAGATGNIYVGLHEFADMGFLLHFLREDDLFFDIGANIGSFTILAAGACKAKCWAFEPSRATLAQLRRNLAANAIEDRVTVFDHALGDRDGEIGFTKAFGAMNHIAEAGESAEVETVRLRRLDDVLGDAQPVFAKIDVEGAEPALFVGAAAFLARPSLKVVQIETIDQSIEAAFAANGFIRRHYDPMTRKLTEHQTQSFANNALFVRDEAFVAARLAGARRFDIAGVTI